jgi:5-methylcytosine-specific restriction endonuclease McrA
MAFSEQMECPKCGETGVPRVRRGETHYTAICGECGSYIKHISKSIFEGPVKENGRRRKATWSAASMGIENCELCGRSVEGLGRHEKLESHHKTPIEHGGEDTKDNILIVCTPCHRMAHYLRTYLNEHMAHLTGGAHV